MESARESAKAIVERITTEFKGFAGSEVGSGNYAVRVVAIEELLTSLARLHPRWSAEEEVILPQAKEDSHQTGKDALFEYSEELVWAWRELNPDHPTADSLATGMARFLRMLAQLCRVTENEMAS